tara:strand:+ start:235 stop:1113 length:879 start_codon:yes stop_codon:yes gene_type:complete
MEGWPPDCPVVWLSFKPVSKQGPWYVIDRSKLDEDRLMPTYSVDGHHLHVGDIPEAAIMDTYERQDEEVDFRSIVREVLSEYGYGSPGPAPRAYSPPYNYSDFDRELLYRGMLVTFPPSLSQEIRKMMMYGEYSDEKWSQPYGKKGTKFSGRMLGNSIVTSLNNGAVGNNWTQAIKIAEHFSEINKSKGKKNTFSVILQAKFNDEGFRPEEGKVFWDEAEFRMPSRTPMEVISISVYNHGTKKLSAEWSWIFLDKNNPIVAPSSLGSSGPVYNSDKQKQLRSGWDEAEKAGR